MQNVKAAGNTYAGFPAIRAAGVLVFVALTIVTAKFAIPLPGTPVPLTLQTLAVTLAGALLGSALGASSQVLYLMLGVTGLPVFAAGGGWGYLAGPTGGYLIAFPVAAALTGWWLSRSRDFGSVVLAMLVANLVILAAGWAQLSIIQGNAELAFVAGVQPFLAGALIKSVLGAAIVKAVRK